jgi:ABC-type phosphate transport system substrate-binding protein
MNRLIDSLFLLSLLTSAFAQADVAVIVNPATSRSLASSDIANIFLGKNKSLKAMDLKDWGPTKEKFYAAVTNKNESQLKSYWSGLVFTGKGQPLPSQEDDAAIVAVVASQPDAIGYIDSGSVNDKVKVLIRLP